MKKWVHCQGFIFEGEKHVEYKSMKKENVREISYDYKEIHICKYIFLKKEQYAWHTFSRYMYVDFETFPYSYKYI